MLDNSGKQRLIHYFKENIERGVFPVGSKVRSTQELADEFNIALTTAHAALKLLEAQGYILRQRGRGTFINSLHAGATGGQGRLDTQVCLVRHSGEAFNEPLGQLLLELKTRDATVDVIEYLYDNDEFLKKHDFNKYRVAILSDPYTAELLSNKFPEVHQIYLGDVSPYSRRRDVVIFNYFEAVYRAVRHFADIGYRKIACYNIATSGRGRFKSLESEHVNSGYESALRDCGLEYSCCLKYSANRKGHDLIRKMLKSSDRPEAVVCVFDHRAAEVAGVAEKLNLKIPEDLALITLGSSAFASEMKLSSVDFRPASLVPVCINIIEDLVDNRRCRFSSQLHLIHTELIIRESCGYRQKSTKR